MEWFLAGLTIYKAVSPVIRALVDDEEQQHGEDPGPDKHERVSDAASPIVALLAQRLGLSDDDALKSLVDDIIHLTVREKNSEDKPPQAKLSEESKQCLLMLEAAVAGADASVPEGEKAEWVGVQFPRALVDALLAEVG